MSRFSLEFDKAAAEQIEGLVKKKGLSKAEIVRRAIALYDAVLEEGGDRPQLTLRTRSGEEKHLVGL